jgi:hypothetical protein
MPSMSETQKVDIGDVGADILVRSDSPMSDPYPNFRPRKWVYVAGPYTRPDPVENTRAAILVGERLYAAGLYAVVPHVNLIQHLVAPKGVDHWYEHDLHALTKCDALLRMPGESTGADLEVEFARRRWIPIFDNEATLLAAMVP